MLNFIKCFFCIFMTNDASLASWSYGLYKLIFNINLPCILEINPSWLWHSPRARHPGMWSQMGLRKHYYDHYEQSSKFSKAVFHSTWTMNFQMFKLDLEKADEPEIKLPASYESLKKQESSRKISTSALSTTTKLFTVWTTRNCGKFWKKWEYQTTWPASWETCMQVRKQQLELDMEQQTGSK